MTAAAPNSELRGLARMPRLARPDLFAPADSGDRNFVTLLALNFMLLAFFVVLGTTASFDQPTVVSVAHSVRAHFAPEKTSTSPLRLNARQTLQAGVSDAFASVLPTVIRGVRDNGDRVDVALAAETVAAVEPHGMDELMDAIAALMGSAPPGVHYQLMLEGGADVPSVAVALLARGVAATNLMTAAEIADDAALRFSFLLLEGDEDAPYAWLVPEAAR